MLTVVPTGIVMTIAMFIPLLWGEEAAPAEREAVALAAVLSRVVMIGGVRKAVFVVLTYCIRRTSARKDP